MRMKQILRYSHFPLFQLFVNPKTFRSYLSQINNSTDFSFTTALRQKSKELHTCCIELKDKDRVCSTRHARNSIGPLPEDYCERKNPKSSVLSVLLLIYDIYLQHYPYKSNHMFKTLKSTSIKTCFLPVVRIHAQVSYQQSKQLLVHLEKIPRHCASVHSVQSAVEYSTTNAP